MEFTIVHKEDLVKLLKNLRNDHHLIQGEHSINII